MGTLVRDEHKFNYVIMDAANKSMDDQERCEERKPPPQRAHDVNITSPQRHDVASTLRRRCIYVMCLPGLILTELPPQDHE